MQYTPYFYHIYHDFTSNVSESKENLIVNYISFGSMFTPFIHGTFHVLLVAMKLME